MKKVVNDHESYTQLMTWTNDKIEIARKNLEVKVDPHEIYRLQGEIIALKKLLKVREEVNGG